MAKRLNPSASGERGRTRFGAHLHTWRLIPLREQLGMQMPGGTRALKSRSSPRRGGGGEGPDQQEPLSLSEGALLRKAFVTQVAQVCHPLGGARKDCSRC